MVQESIEEVILDEDTIAEERAQQIAMERGFFDGPIPNDIPAPQGLSPKQRPLSGFAPPFDGCFSHGRLSEVVRQQLRAGASSPVMF